uniref:Omp-1-4 n=1 Tax=Ehrlichia ewingii TaxID=947 RepID=B1N6A7_9RICK|nr:Omp-1-4 [Ehrlichia ewingii]
MFMKKLYYLNFTVLVLTVYLFPSFVFSMQGRSNITGSYITVSYQPSMSNFRNFHIKETNFDTKDPIGLIRSARSTEPSVLKINTHFYKPQQSDSYKSYGNDLLGFSTSIGLLVKNLRMEFEGSYKKFDIKRLVNYASRDGHRYFAIPRDTFFNNSIPYAFNAYTVAKNNGLSIISNMINLCYESIKYNNFMPYICLGAGGDFIELFDSMRIKFAYQGKLGVSYPLTSNLVLAISGQYHKVVGDKFKFLPLMLSPSTPRRRIPPQSSSEVQDATGLLTLDLGYFSADIGLRFMF